MADWNKNIIEEFRANQGKVGGPFEGRALALVHHKGAKTGAERVNPLAVQKLSDDSWAVFASMGGAPTHPDWYYNLVANPEAKLETADETIDVIAHEAKGDERTPIWEQQKKDWPGFAEYEEKTKGIREIPVFVLERKQQ